MAVLAPFPSLLLDRAFIGSKTARQNAHHPNHSKNSFAERLIVNAAGTGRCRVSLPRLQRDRLPGRNTKAFTVLNSAMVPSAARQDAFIMLAQDSGWFRLKLIMRC